MKKRIVKVFTDGACSGNPGRAGVGFVVIDCDGKVVKKFSKYIGLATNNIAEYTALLEALKFVSSLDFDGVEIYLDSELIVKQLNGEYRVRNEKLKTLFKEVNDLLGNIKNYSIVHIDRELNEIADKLAKDAVKYGTDSGTN